MRQSVPFISTLLLLCGCATVNMPEVPEHHPGHRDASEGYMEPSFKVLRVEPSLPPQLPVPRGHQQPPDDMQMDHGGGDMNHDGDDRPSHMRNHEGARWGDELDQPLHGHVHRPGMQSAMPGDVDAETNRHSTGHAMNDEEHDANGLPPVVLPQEQRGMQVSEAFYHKHEGQYSTQIVQPNRERLDTPLVGRQRWTCPRHPQVVAATPGGRCALCETALVPVKVAAHE